MCFSINPSTKSPICCSCKLQEGQSTLVVGVKVTHQSSFYMLVTFQLRSGDISKTLRVSLCCCVMEVTEPLFMSRENPSNTSTRKGTLHTLQSSQWHRMLLTACLPLYMSNSPITGNKVSTPSVSSWCMATGRKNMQVSP